MQFKLEGSKPLYIRESNFYFEVKMSSSRIHRHTGDYLVIVNP